MALTPTIVTKTSVSDTDGGTSTSSSPITPVAQRYLIAVVCSEMDSISTPNTPTVSGNGQSWASIKSQVFSTSCRISIHGCTVVSPSAGAVTADFGGQSQDIIMMSIFEVDPGDAAYTAYLVQSASASNSNLFTDSITVSLSPFTDAVNNMSIGGCYLNALKTITVGSGYTQIHNFQTSNHRDGTLCTEYKKGDDDPDWTWTDSRVGAVAIEVGFSTGVTGALAKGRLLKGSLTGGRLL